MKYYELTYPNHTTLMLKSVLPIEEVLRGLSKAGGVVHQSGVVYNPQAFLTLTQTEEPSDRLKLLAQSLDEALLG